MRPVGPAHINGMNLPHLLILGWYRPGTGFTRVLEALAARLSQGFRITWFGVGYRGDPVSLSHNLLLQPTNLRGGDLVGAYAVRARWDELQPDAVLALNDLWYLKHYSEQLGPIRGSVPMLGYLPLDGRIGRADAVDGLEGFTSLTTYTHSAARDLEQALRASGSALRVAVSGHGVDLESFAPAPDIVAADYAVDARMLLAQRYFELAGPAFVVLNASRPDPRKRIDLTLAGFAEFARDKPANVRLCLHQAIAGHSFVEPLREQARALGIHERILWSPHSPGPLEDGCLNQLYNACAVGINTALGEGFGLVSFEHAATAAVQLVPDLPSLRELWQDGAILLGPVSDVPFLSSPLIMGEVPIGAIAPALERVYADNAEYRRRALGALQRARSPVFSWDVVAEEFADLLRQSMRRGRVEHACKEC